MNRIVLVLLAFFLHVSGTLAWGNPPKQEVGDAARPNILLICVDDLKPTLGCYGDQHARTPNLDALAKRSFLMERAYCNQAVCSPSRNALLTGLRPTTLGIYDLPTHFRLAQPEVRTMPQWFKEHGYYTEAMGKIFHVGHGNHDDAESWSVPHWTPKGPGYFLESNMPPAAAEPKSGTKPEDRPRGAPYESADVSDESYADGKIAQEAVQRLQRWSARSDRTLPFFMAIGFQKPHLPFCAPKKYWDMHDASKLPMPSLSDPPQGAPEFAPTTWGELRQYADIPKQGSLTPEQTRKLIHGYYAATSYMDAQVGLVLGELERQGLASNTIVVLWGDHGWHLGDHGMWCKHSNYEQASRIPLLISVPQQQENGSRQVIMESVDLFPTLASIAGIPSPANIDGINLHKQIVENSANGVAPGATVATPTTDDTNNHAYHCYPRGNRLGRAIRTERYRLVRWEPWSGEDTEVATELYDYQADPLESRNLAQENPEIVKRLTAILQTYPKPKPQFKTTGNKASGSAPKQDRAAMFQRRDIDLDGELTRGEFLKNQPDPDEAPARFEKFDIDRNGRLSRQEFIQAGKTSK